ncbi:MAG: GAF domain-containing sensor histidine kinase [Saccharospirillum sp.]
MSQEPISLSLDTQAGLPGLLVTIGERYARATREDIDAVITESLGLMGAFVNADRVYVFDYDFTHNETSNTHEWCAEGIAPERDNLQRVPLDAIDIWVRNHREGKAVYVAQVQELPEDHALREMLEPQGIQSLLALPLMAHGELMGFVGFDAVRQPRVYSEEERVLLSVFGQMLINIKTQVAAIAALSEAKEQAERTVRAKDAFLNTMSHELRTPMNAIIGFAELLKSHDENASTQAYVDPILQAGQRLSGLIDDILAFSELDASGEALNARPVALDGLLAGLQHEHQGDASARGLVLEMPARMNATFTLDATKLRKVLSHLIANGIKFTEAGSVRLDVGMAATESGQTEVTFAVVDTGIGIHPDDQERIFTPFNQADNQLTRKYGGAGLSLALCKRLVQVMGGTLHLASQPGAGSRFSFSLVAD